MPLPQLSLSTRPMHGAEFPSRTSAESPPLSPVQQGSQEVINSMLDVQNSADPGRFINQLPDHIKTLQQLAEKEHYVVPRAVEELAKAQGFSTPLLPCTTGGTAALRMLTITELQSQLDHLNEQVAALSGIHKPSAELRIRDVAGAAVNGYKYMLLLAVANNIYSAGRLMLQHSAGRETNTLLGLAREVIALAIHMKLFRDMHRDTGIIDQIKNSRNTNLQDLPQWNLDNPADSLETMLGKINLAKEQSQVLRSTLDKSQEKFLKKDVPAMLMGFLTLALAGQMINMATR